MMIPILSVEVTKRKATCGICEDVIGSESPRVILTIPDLRVKRRYHPHCLLINSLDAINKITKRVNIPSEIISKIIKR